jgi:tricorn protease
MNGLNWPQVSKRYLELASRVTTTDEFDHVANRLVGELNGSHLGINSPDPTNPLQQPMGRLGIHRKRIDGNAYLVTEVFENGPAAKGPMRLLIGDVITAVEGQPIGAPDTLESALQGRVGKETLLTVKRSPNAGEPADKAGDAARELQLLITPISFEAESRLFYDHWRNATARKVADLSGGKIGYIHIRGMDQGSLDTFERDLYAAADSTKGLIIDVRNNGGGWTTDRLLASIMYPRHAYTQPRGVPIDVTHAYPQDRLFIQRYDRPVNMLCNENSFSNAEIISHAFKNLKRGTLVGQRTAGGVISTGGTTLIDGTSVRLPFRGWFTPDGKNMELNGAAPDLLVVQTPQSEEKDEDVQLKAAVEDLAKRLE